MIQPEYFLRCLSSAGVNRFVGVPDSLLKNLLTCLDKSAEVDNHVIAANEGAAVGYAVGAYLESGRPAAVYFQNSGLGNAINPLTALAHKNVYGIPMVLIIGWRGEPGKPDEPQHLVQGGITRSLLDAIGTPHIVLDSAADTAQRQIGRLLEIMTQNPQPVAIVVPSNTFEVSEALVAVEDRQLPLTREQALAHVVERIPCTARVVATTGMLGRELWEFRRTMKLSHGNDFLVVGGMGHSSSIAHGIAEANPEGEVWCLDGDGSIIMHMGTLAVIGQHHPKNLRHVIFNNFCHDSVGGQQTASSAIDFSQLSKALGYRWVGSAQNRGALTTLVNKLRDTPGPAIVEIRIGKGSRANLGRPPTEIFTTSPRFVDRGNGVTDNS